MVTMMVGMKMVVLMREEVITTLTVITVVLMVVTMVVMRGDDEDADEARVMLARMWMELETTLMARIRLVMITLML